MKIIAIWSESGGVGKSTTAWFIASGLAEIGPMIDISINVTDGSNKL